MRRLSLHTLAITLGVVLGCVVFGVRASGAVALSVVAPSENQVVAGLVPFSAVADSPGLISLQFHVDGQDVGAPITSGPCQAHWDSTQVSDGLHTVQAIGTDEHANRVVSPLTTITVRNAVPPPSPNQSPDCFKGASVTDAAGAVWTLNATGNALRDGVQLGLASFTGYWYVSGVVYITSDNTLWRRWDGTSWVMVSPPICVTPTPTPTPVPTNTIDTLAAQVSTVDAKVSTTAAAVTALDQRVQTFASAVNVSFTSLLTATNAPKDLTPSALVAIEQAVQRQLQAFLTPPQIATVPCVWSTVNSSSVYCRAKRSDFPSAVVGGTGFLVK